MTGFFDKTDDTGGVKGKAKATYYVSIETLEDLDQAWLQLRKVGYSKSQIVDAALQMALADLAENPQTAVVFSWLPPAE